MISEVFFKVKPYYRQVQVDDKFSKAQERKECLLRILSLNGWATEVLIL